MWLKLERDVNSFGLPKVKLRTIIDFLTSRVMFPELMFIRELVFLSNGHQYMGERERKITKILLHLHKRAGSAIASENNSKKRVKNTSKQEQLVPRD